MYLHLKISEHHVSAEVNMYPHGGSLTATGSAGYHVNGGYAPFSGTLTVLFYANGLYPVSAQLVFAGEVLPDTGRFGSQLAANVPLVTSVPGGPDVSIVSVQTTIGPSHLTYYKHVHGRRVPFRPRGVSVPERCPHGGFPFAADFTFQDGSKTSAQTTVSCPPGRHR